MKYSKLIPRPWVQGPRKWSKLQGNGNVEAIEVVDVDVADVSMLEIIISATKKLWNCVLR